MMMEHLLLHPKWLLMSVTSLTSCKEELVIEDLTNKLDYGWFVQEFYYSGHLNILRQKPFTETYSLSDGKCMLLEMEFIITISKKEEEIQEETNLEELHGYEIFIFFSKSKINY
jgi:hypothetical protein